MPNLIGTGLDQVPVNGMLGDLAFQNKESVEFTGGSGTLSHLDISAINATKNITAVDVFVYDTSKDSDGGAWRKRTQHTSWYNEELNTSVRGSRREFPAVAVIVAEAARVTIYDGDDASLPMWMVFNLGTSFMINQAGTTRVLAAVSALNAKLVTPLKSGTNNGTIIIDFVKDFGFEINQGSQRYGVQHKIIANRNINATTFVNFDLTNVLVSQLSNNDVAMTVLPNAPIDPATGLPTPTIAVATDAGVSIIKDDGSVVDITSANGWIKSGYLTFDQDNYIVSHVGNATGQGLMFRYPIPSANRTLNSGDRTVMLGGGNIYNQESPHFGNALGGLSKIAYDENGVAVNAKNNATDILVKYWKNDNDYTKSSVAYISSKYNTGWMPGAIKGAWLSDTTQETFSAINLISNPTCDTTTGYQVYGATATMAAGGGVITFTATVTSLFGGGTYVNNLIPGRQYTYKATVSTSYASPSVRIQISGVGLRNASGVLSAAGTKVVQDSFIATATTHFIEFLDYSTHPIGTQFTIDNVNIQLADSDRSDKTNALEVFGKITKTPVATGADLVAYSGFSASNYLQQPYNSALDFGTGDFCYTWWANITSVPAYLTHFAREYHNGSAFVGSSIEVFTESSAGKLRIYFTDDGYSTYDVWNSSTVAYGVGWQHFAIVRTGNTVSTYINGTFDNSHTLSAAVASLDNANAKLYISRQANGSSPMTNGSLALFRASATAPSAEQIKKMYEDEKVLFQDNAKAVLYGSSDSVTALAYDDDTNLLHVGTSAGRSDFQGLRRINNTTSAIGTAISAVDGFIVEE